MDIICTPLRSANQLLSIVWTGVHFHCDAAEIFCIKVEALWRYGVPVPRDDDSSVRKARPARRSISASTASRATYPASVSRARRPAVKTSPRARRVQLLKNFALASRTRDAPKDKHPAGRRGPRHVRLLAGPQRAGGPRRGQEAALRRKEPCSECQKDQACLHFDSVYLSNISFKLLETHNVKEPLKSHSSTAKKHLRYGR